MPFDALLQKLAPAKRSGITDVNVLSDPYVFLFCRVLTSLVFAVSLVGKVADITSFRAAIRSLVPIRGNAVWLVLCLVFLAELSVVVLMLIAGDLLVLGFALAALLLGAFTTALVVSLAQGRKVSCNCFGKSKEQVTGFDVARNTILIIVAALSALFLAGSPAPRAGFEPLELLTVTVMSGTTLAFLLHLRDVSLVVFPRSAPKDREERA
ncbi:MauE/DoxX family redox-associated membrane protein [Streptosporangium sp. NPDC006930]|uniref:MauE/DoxX family redox-associated membrane protein n=1 Tax=unclassified Streptosporangium TaxID=2632669 RepID=UPI003441BFBC